MELTKSTYIVLSSDLYRDKLLEDYGLPKKVGRYPKTSIFQNIHHCIDEDSIIGYRIDELLLLYNEDTEYNKDIIEMENVPLSRFPVIYLLIYLMTPLVDSEKDLPTSYYTSINYILIRYSELSWECISTDDSFEASISLSYSINIFKKLWN